MSIKVSSLQKKIAYYSWKQNVKSIFFPESGKKNLVIKIMDYVESKPEQAQNILNKIRYYSSRTEQLYFYSLNSKNIELNFLANFDDYIDEAIKNVCAYRSFQNTFYKMTDSAQQLISKIELFRYKNGLLDFKEVFFALEHDPKFLRNNQGFSKLKKDKFSNQQLETFYSKVVDKLGDDFKNENTTDALNFLREYSIKPGFNPNGKAKFLKLMIKKYNILEGKDVDTLIACHYYIKSIKELRVLYKGTLNKIMNTKNGYMQISKSQIGFLSVENQKKWELDCKNFETQKMVDPAIKDMIKNSTTHLKNIYELRKISKKSIYFWFKKINEVPIIGNYFNNSEDLLLNPPPPQYLDQVHRNIYMTRNVDNAEDIKFLAKYAYQGIFSKVFIEFASIFQDIFNKKQGSFEKYSYTKYDCDIGNHEITGEQTDYFVYQRNREKPFFIKVCQKVNQKKVTSTESVVLEISSFEGAPTKAFLDGIYQAHEFSQPRNTLMQRDGYDPANEKSALKWYRKVLITPSDFLRRDGTSRGENLAKLLGLKVHQ